MKVKLLCLTSDIFMDSIDTIRNKKTKSYTAMELKFIDEVGPNFVIQICTDNATNMLGAIDNIVTTYSHVLKQGCVVHARVVILGVQRLTGGHSWRASRRSCLLCWARIGRTGHIL
jgi:hypothetical protein